MNIIVSKAIASLVVISIALSHPAFADAIVVSPSQSYFDDILKECNAQLNEWQRLWKIEVGLAFLVLVLGAVSAGIQNFNFQSVKVVTVMCGLVITVTTGFINQVGWDDYRTLNKSIVKVQSIVRNMNRAKRDYGIVKEGDKDEQLKTFGDLYANFKKIQEPPPDPIIKTDNFGYSIINTAYAEFEDPPSWVRTIPEDTKNLYFVGIADSTKLGDAKTTSKDNAIQNATSFLAETLNTNGDIQLDINKLALSLAEASEDVDNDMGFDEKKGIYRYYSLIRINKSLAEAGIKLFAVQRGVNAPAALIVAIGDSQRVRDDYSTKQLKQYETLLNETSASLSKDEYQKFSEARDLRKEKKDYPKAIAIFNEILANKPEFYMGWYNLALAYAASGNDADARKAYDKTIALEPAQPSRDGTVYNAYGHFLLERKQYCEAIPHLEKALRLDQNNPRAQNNLKQARSRLQEADTVCQ